MGETIQYPTQRKTSRAYLAQPPNLTNAPGILLIHAWWGLNPFFRDLADRLAAEGYTTLAPDLYDGKYAGTFEEAHALRGAKSPIPRSAMVSEAARHLQALTASPLIAVIGFSMGAALALSLAESHPSHIASIVTFYGARNGDYSQSKASYLLHFAATDPYCTPNAQKNLENALQKAARPTRSYIYINTEHWFFESNRPEYDPDAASLAWDRTLAFLRRHVP